MMRQDPRRIHEIFQRAIELSAKERGAFLDRACAGNTGGRNRVERLLAASRSPLPWLEGAVFEAVPDLFDGEQPAPIEGRRLEPDGLPQGRRLGPFELLRELGRGGMGVVYEARRADDQYDQRVAIKLIRGELATPREARRLRQERQILASLEHPHIARLLAGDVTPEGLPYLVMEYVEGEPLEAWCRRVEASLEVRIELFRQVCLAVQYAHRHLVVHCDLKPGNVLVTADGVPKLLDFGIARLLDHDFVPRLATTIVSGGRMTPQFASPEQARGERLTAASDIYSLGVMLYRLLTGCPPYRLDGASAYEMQRIVCEKEPEAPSVVANRSLTEQATDASRPPGNLRRRLAGDLDNIVAMTLRKEPERRYASAQQLSEDLRRHLAGLPVVARRDTFSYRAGKFAYRHRASLVAVALVLLALVAGQWIANVERARAQDARQQAQSERVRAQSVAAFLTGLFNDADSAGEISAGALLAAPEGRAARELLLAEGARRIAVELANQPGLQADLMQRIGDAYRNLGTYDAAEVQLLGALEIRRRTFGGGSPEVASSLDSLCVLRLSQGQLDAAEARCRQSLSIRRESARSEPLLIAESLNSLALVLREQVRLDQAESLLREALHLRRLNLPERHRSVTTLLNNLAVLLQHKGSYTEAEHLLREVLARKLELYGTEHLQVVNSLNNLASLLQDLARVAGDTQRFTEAEDLYRQALKSGRGLSGDGHPLVATVHFNLGTLLAELGRHAEASQLLEAALDIDQRLFGDEHPDVARDLKTLAVVAHRQGRGALAQTYLRRALEIYGRTLGVAHPSFYGVLFSLTTPGLRAGNEDEVQGLLESTLENWRRSPPAAAWVAPRAATLLGTSLLRDGLANEAEPWLRQAYEDLCGAVGPGHDFTRQALDRRIELHDVRGEATAAARLRRLSASESASCTLED